MLDPELLTDAKKQNLDITPTGGEELEGLGKQVMASQEPVVIDESKIIGGMTTSYTTSSIMDGTAASSL